MTNLYENNADAKSVEVQILKWQKLYLLNVFQHCAISDYQYILVTSLIHHFNKYNRKLLTLRLLYTNKTIFWMLGMRKDKPKTTTEGKIEGARHRGKQRGTLRSDVTDWCGLNQKCVRMAESRKEWSSMAADLFKKDGIHSGSDTNTRFDLCMLCQN